MFKLMNIFEDHPRVFSTGLFKKHILVLVLTLVAFPFIFNSDFFLKILGLGASAWLPPHLMAPIDQMQDMIM
jgi:hypothetical protein